MSIQERPSNIITDQRNGDLIVESNEKPRFSVIKDPTVQNVALKVTAVTKEKWAELSEISGAWRKNALAICRREDVGVVFYEDRIQGDNAWMFAESARICGSIQGNLTTFPNGRPEGKVEWDTVLACEDSAGNTQGIALVNSADNKLAFLATNPDNIRHKVNENIPNRIQGAGTEIMLYLAERALETGNAVRLKAISSAAPFYEKLHFEPAPEDASGSDADVIPMKLTSQKIRQYIDDQIVPYNRYTSSEQHL
jgi:hypothetical protein